MKKREPVKEIMTTNLDKVIITNKMSDVLELFSHGIYNHLPVVNGDELIGLISRTDVDRITYFNSSEDGSVNTAVYNMISIEQLMTKEIHTIESETPIKEAAEILSEGKFHALPVVDNGQLKGIVTSKDIIRYFLAQF